MEEYPQYQKGGGNTLSKAAFYKYLVEYAKFKEGVDPDVGRDIQGRYMVIKQKPTA
jgi:hypothetical protein